LALTACFTDSEFATADPGLGCSSAFSCRLLRHSVFRNRAAIGVSPDRKQPWVAEKRNFEFDTVQMPLNVMDAHFRSFGKEVLPVLVKKNIGVLGMKSMASGHILANKTVSAIDCLHYALRLPTSVLITGVDRMAVLDQAFEAAKTFSKVSKEDLAAILEKTKPSALDGLFEPFKTSAIFDSAAAHPEWLGYM